MDPEGSPFRLGMEEPDHKRRARWPGILAPFTKKLISSLSQVDYIIIIDILYNYNQVLAETVSSIFRTFGTKVGMARLHLS